MHCPPASPSLPQTLDGHSHNISTVAFHPELPLIMTGSEDGTVKLWHRWVTEGTAARQRNALQRDALQRNARQRMHAACSGGWKQLKESASSRGGSAEPPQQFGCAAAVSNSAYPRRSLTRPSRWCRQ